jgi:hypothetical protein
MAITKPVIFTEVTDAETDGKRPVSEETVRKMIQNINMLRALTPYAEVRGVHINLVGSGIPNAPTWLNCDGSEITVLDTPLNTVATDVTPDMQDRFLRGAPESVTSGNEAGGSASASFNHTHTIDAVNHPGNLLEAGDEEPAFLPSHTHGLDADPTNVTCDVAHLKVGFYMRVYK